MNARKYLETYYVSGDATEHENLAITRFMTRTANMLLGKNNIILDISCGPSLLNSIPMINKVKQIDYLDYSETCLDELRKWKAGDATAWNWSNYFLVAKKTLNHQKLLRQVMGNFYCSDGIGSSIPKIYDAVLCTFGIEVAAKNLSDFENRIKQCLSVLKPKGVFALAFIEDTETWAIDNEEEQHCLKISVKEIRRIFQPYKSFPFRQMIYCVPSSKHKEYKGFIFCSGKI